MNNSFRFKVHYLGFQAGIEDLQTSELPSDLSSRFRSADYYRNTTKGHKMRHVNYTN